MIHVLGLPLDLNSSYQTGPALAPRRILEALHSDSSNLSSESGLDLGEPGLWHDAGDLDFGTQTDPAALAQQIEQAVARELASGARVLSLGGDHSVSYPVIRAHAQHHGPVNILHLDAHPDLYPDMLNNRYSHASPFARLLEDGCVKRLVQVGIRTLNRPQREQAEKYGVEMIEMRAFHEPLNLHFDGPTYVSLDLDVLDPAFAPGVSHHEPGGLSTREVIRVLHSLGAAVIGADLVEYNPLRDLNGVTAMVAAKLLKELIDLLHRSPQPHSP